jgi:type I restriction enzyme, S subunit
LGWVPKGWVISQIKDIADINPESWNSKTAPSEVEYLDLSNAKDGSILSTEIYSFDEAPSRARRVLNKHDTAFGLVRPANRSFAYIDRNGLTGSTGFAVIRAKKTHYKNYIYCCLTDSDVIDEFARVADGGAYPAIKNEDIVDLNVIFPSEILLKRFDISVSELREKIIINTGNNQTLAELRDTLLPKLISGELRLDEIPSP